MIWLFGMLLILAYAVFSYISIRKKTSASIRLEGENNVFVCDEIETPFILGIIKPVIYLPSGLDDETTKNVLAHEKAHIKRFDHLRKQFGFLILAVYWFNPLVWIQYALFCKDIELACDEKVISHMSLDEKKSYANLSEDEAKVTIFHAETPEYEPYAIINFSDADHGISVGLMKPWGEDGIYVPVRFLQPVEELISSSIYEEEFGIENDKEEDGIMNLPYQEGSDKEVINLPHKDGDEEIRDVR